MAWHEQVRGSAPGEERARGPPGQALQLILAGRGLGRCSGPAGPPGLLLALSDCVEVGVVSPPDPSLHGDGRSKDLGLSSAGGKLDTASPPTVCRGQEGKTVA